MTGGRRVRPTGKGIGLRDRLSWPRGNRHDFTLGPVIDMALGRNASGKPWNLNPPYQRGRVWTVRQQELYIGHVLDGGAAVPFYINAPWRGNAVPEVVDGQQRVSAWIEFVEGRVLGEFEDGERVAYADFSDSDRGTFDMLIVQPVYEVDLSPADRVRLYLKLNRGGSVHTDAEIERARAYLREVEAQAQNGGPR